MNQQTKSFDGSIGVKDTSHPIGVHDEPAERSWKAKWLFALSTILMAINIGIACVLAPFTIDFILCLGDRPPGPPMWCIPTTAITLCGAMIAGGGYLLGRGRFIWATCVMGASALASGAVARYFVLAIMEGV